MSAARVALARSALLLLGSDVVNSFDEGTELAEIVNGLLDDTTRALQSAYPWRFTLAKARLARVQEAPIGEWTHAHALPAELLVLRQLFASAAVGAPSVLEYERFGNRVFSNRADLWADYQLERDPSLWPPYFTDVARHALAAVLAVPVADSTDRADFYTRRAFGTPSEGGAGGLMGLARRLDAQQQPPQALASWPLIAARHGGWR